MPVMITEDTSIDYDVHGHGPPLLLINGLGFGRWGWFKQVPALSRHFRTITFDIRGEQDLKHGVADLCAETVALLEHLGIEKAHVLGTSLGGFVAQELALERPEMVDRLVLVCTSYGGSGPETMSLEALGRMLGWGSLTSESAVRRGLEEATSEGYRIRNPEEYDLIVRWRLADSPSLFDYYQRMAAGARFDASREVEKISSPTLVIHGEEDRYVPLANARALAEAIPGARLRVLEDAGHLVFIERAEEVNKEIISFLKPRERRKVRRRHVKPRAEQTRKLIERARGANEGIVSFLKSREPQKRWRPRIQPAKQKTKKLIERGREANEEITSFLERFKPRRRHNKSASTEQRKPQEAKKAAAIGRLGGWLRSRVPGGWITKLRDRLSR